jgi:phosphoribosyl 1,2-cyclic phosphodiesterase
MNYGSHNEFGQHLAMSEEYKRRAMAHANNPMVYWHMCGKAYEHASKAFYSKAMESQQYYSPGMMSTPDMMQRGTTQ